MGLTYHRRIFTTSSITSTTSSMAMSITRTHLSIITSTTTASSTVSRCLYNTFINHNIL